MGDWDGDGLDGVGVRRLSERRFYVRYWASAGPTQFTAVWGTESDRPVVGDWNTDGKDKPTGSSGCHPSRRGGAAAADDPGHRRRRRWPELVRSVAT